MIPILRKFATIERYRLQRHNSFHSVKLEGNAPSFPPKRRAYADTAMTEHFPPDCLFNKVELVIPSDKCVNLSNLFAGGLRSLRRFFADSGAQVFLTPVSLAVFETRAGRAYREGRPPTRCVAFIMTCNVCMNGCGL